MKTHKDPRHLKRIKIMQELYAWDFRKKNPKKSSSHIIKKLKKIDAWITQAAPTWPLEKINRVDLAVLRLSVFELMIDKTTPPKVIVDEAVEIAKEFGGQSAPSFINGALGKLISDQNISTS